MEFDGTNKPVGTIVNGDTTFEPSDAPQAFSASITSNALRSSSISSYTLRVRFRTADESVIDSRSRDRWMCVRSC
jgi:hypothetical protein